MTVSRKITAAALAFVMLVSAAALRALADEGGADMTNPRFTDYSGVVTQESASELDRMAKEGMQRLQCDFPIFVSDSYNGMDSLYDYAGWLYETYRYGYGLTKSAIVLVLDNSKPLFVIRYFGNALLLSNDAEKDGLSERFKDIYGSTETYYDCFAEYIKEVHSFAEKLIGRKVPEAAFDLQYRRFNDLSGVVTEEQELELNKTAQDGMESLHCDFPICVTGSLGEETLEEFAARIYETYGYGYGATKSGMLLAVDNANARFMIYCHGNADRLITDAERNELSETFKNTWNGDGTPYDAFAAYIKTAHETASAMLKREYTLTERADGMPYWYPEDVSSFRNFHGSDLKRVVDDAGILTDEQEVYLAGRIQKIVDDYGYGYVIFTDIDNHGLDKSLYAADFLYFNGYGTGDDYSATVFYLSLEPENRGWRTISTNSCESIFTPGIVYDIDETVDADIRAGRYYEAFVKHVDFVEALYKRLNDLPDWYPEGTAVTKLDRYDRKFAESPDISGVRVYDESGVLTPDQETVLTARMNEMVEKFGYDLLIFIVPDYHALSLRDYAEDYYYYTGHSKDGVTVYFLTGENSDEGILTFGKCSDKYSDDLVDSELLQWFYNSNYDYGVTADTFLSKADFLFRFGALPMSAGGIIGIIAFASLFGLIAGIVHVRSCMQGMKIEVPEEAGRYLVANSFNLRSRKVSFLYSNTVRVAIPKESSSSGGGGGSSYSSGSSSSGGSYSGGGRDF